MAETGIKRYSLSRQVADSLEKLIEDGEYKIGDKIPTEVELMERFDVSRNTVREAVRCLTSSGILEVKQGDGTYVKFNNRFNGYMNSKCETVSERDIQESRIALEIAIAHFSAERRTESDLKKIKEKLELRQGQKINSKENTMADVEFHMAIAESAHTKLIFDLYQSISTFLLNHISQRHAETELNSEIIDKLHEELFVAIKEKDSAKASICARNILNI